MRRLLWLGVGIGIGVMVVRVVTRKAKAFTPSGLVGQAQEAAGGVSDAISSFVHEFRESAAEREDEIRTAFAEGIALDAPDLPWARDVGIRFNSFKQQLQEGE